MKILIVANNSNLTSLFYKVLERSKFRKHPEDFYENEYNHILLDNNRCYQCAPPDAKHDLCLRLPEDWTIAKDIVQQKLL